MPNIIPMSIAEAERNGYTITEHWAFDPIGCKHFPLSKECWTAEQTITSAPSRFIAKQSTVFRDGQPCLVTDYVSNPEWLRVAPYLHPVERLNRIQQDLAKIPADYFAKQQLHSPSYLVQQAEKPAHKPLHKPAAVKLAQAKPNDLDGLISDGITRDDKKGLEKVAKRLYEELKTDYDHIELLFSPERKQALAEKAHQAIRIYFYLDSDLDLKNINHKPSHAGQALSLTHCVEIKKLLNDAYQKNELVHQTVEDDTVGTYLFRHNDVLTLIADVFADRSTLLNQRLTLSKEELTEFFEKSIGRAETDAERKTRQRLEQSIVSYNITAPNKKTGSAYALMDKFSTDISQLAQKRYAGNAWRGEEPESSANEAEKTSWTPKMFTAADSSAPTPEKLQVSSYSF